MKILGGRIEAQGNQLGPLQGERTKCLRPASVVTDEHAHDRILHAPGAKTQVAHLEVFFFQMLEGGLRFVIGVTGQMNLAVFANDIARRRHQDSGIEATCLAVDLGELGIAQIKADAIATRVIKQRLRYGRRHRALKKTLIDFLLIVKPVARK